MVWYSAERSGKIKKNSLKSDRNIVSWCNYARRQLRCAWLWAQQKDERHWQLEVARTEGRGPHEMETRVAELNYKDKRKRCPCTDYALNNQYWFRVLSVTSQIFEFLTLWELWKFSENLTWFITLWKWYIFTGFPSNIAPARLRCERISLRRLGAGSSWREEWSITAGRRVGRSNAARSSRCETKYVY